jgi:MMP endo-(1,4)-3-O-methyl-alpha-D-mannosidase
MLRRDPAFVEHMWPVVRRALEFVVAMQLPFGGIAWSQEWDQLGPARVNRQALLAGSSSIYQSLRAGVALAELVDDAQPEWELSGGRLGHALREHRDEFLDKSSFSMDWYYPVLGGAVRGQAGIDLLASRWDDFVVPGLGILCVETNPWVTGAETCELVMALDCIDDRARALQLYADMQHLRHENGSYWTGYVYPEDVRWPGEQTTYTAAAVILAADELSRTTAASGIMRGETLAAPFQEIGLECSCFDDASADVLSRRS